MIKRGRPKTLFDGETSREMRIRRATAFLIDPLRAFIPALDALENAKTLPSLNARNTAKPSNKKIRYQTFVLAVQKVRHTRRLSKLDTISAIRNAVAELQYIRREIVKEEQKVEIDECVAKIVSALK
jgi:hypothetical protein